VSEIEQAVEGSRSTGDVVARALARAPLPAPDACADLAAALGPFAVVDLETTGLDPALARAIEIGAVVVRPDRPPEVFHRFVDPREPLPAFTRRLTGLSDADLAGAPAWDEASRDLAERVTGATVVAHNAAFERAFLAGLLPSNTRFLDTLELACVLRPELAGHSLGLLARDLLGRRESHRALDDALDTVAVLALLREGLRAGGHERLQAALAQSPAWSWRRFVERDGGAACAPLRLVGERMPERSAVPTERRRASAPAVPAAWLEPDFVRALLADEGRWQAAFPGYRARFGQIDLACAMLEAFRSDRAFAAEAGTGIGKTLAYGLVSLLHVLHTGERVVISSANRTLQERVVREELPRIAAVLGVAPPPAIVLKGRANYASPRRLRAVAADPESLGFALSPAARAYLTSFLERCGDRDLLGFGGWLGSHEPALWSLRDRIACSLECDESSCLADPDGACAYLRRVAALREAAIVSINHALLLTWPARYGPIGRLVIDEAHELPGEADRSFSEEIRARELRGRLRQLAGPGGRSGIAAALAATSGARETAARVGALARACMAAVEDAGRALALATGSTDAPVPPASAIEPGSPWDDAGGALARLADELCRLGGAVEELVARHRAATGAGRDDAVAGEGAVLASWLLGAGRGLLADALQQARPDTVYAARGLARPEGFDFWLRATPVETAALLHARLLEPARTVIAVSATLGVGGDPAPSLRKLGWFELERERRLPALAVPSPFDYRRRCVLALVRGDGWRQPGFAARCASAIADVAGLLGGRTLALFTNRNRLSDVVARLAPRLSEEGIAVLAHERSGGAARLVEHFVADPRAVLVGSRSLWQGVDVPGDALSCVVIDKLPFPRHDDPVARGRAERVVAEGRDPFRDLALEPAVVAFKQMFGRLIRSETDRGFVVVLGADLSRSYVEEFVASLPGPPALVTGTWPEILAEMRAFFASGAQTSTEPPVAPFAGG